MPLLRPCGPIRSTWWCEQCGVNHVYGGGLCSMCQAEEDFYNCTYCGGTSCTGECDDEEDVS